MTKLDKLIEAYLSEVSPGWVATKTNNAGQKLLRFPGIYRSGWTKKMKQSVRITEKNALKEFGSWKRASSGKKYEEMLARYDKANRS